MGRNKGICTLCGRGAKLTFEHIPAEASGNQRNVVMFSLDEWLARDPTTGTMAGGRLQPEGMGLLALCENCNNNVLNVHYVRAYCDFVDAGKQMLSSIADKLDGMNRREKATIVVVRFLAVDRLAVAKQLVAWLLITCGRDVVTAHPELADFVLNPSARGLSDRYRLFLALTPGPAAKTTGLSVRADLTTENVTALAEIVYPPFAYALSFNGESVYGSGEITTWTKAPVGFLADEGLNLPLGFCHTAFPGDLRTGAQIEKQVQGQEGENS